MPKSHRDKKKRKTHKTHPRPEEEQIVIGNYASLVQSNVKTTHLFRNTTLRQVKYYKMKVEQDLHWGKHGGIRSQKVSDSLLAHIILLLAWVCDYNPGFALHEYVELIFWTYGIQISVTWTHNVFANLMHFSYRKLNVIQRAKFSEENIDYYYTFVKWIQGIDCTRLVWVDESHFDSRTQKPRHGRGRRGKRINFVNDTSISENFSLTALMRSGQPIY